jgi:hypothetical protein
MAVPAGVGERPVVQPHPAPCDHARCWNPVDRECTTLPPRSRRVRRLSNTEWLRTRIEAGDTTRDVARKLKCTPRTVRNALHRQGIPLPREARNAAIDLDEVFDRYRRGVPVKQIAASLGVTAGWVTDRVKAHGIVRDVPIKRASRPSRFPELEDPDWLRRQLAHDGMTKIAKMVGTTRTNVRAAISRHGITPPPRDADRLARASWTPDTVMRIRWPPSWRPRPRRRSTALGQFRPRSWTRWPLAGSARRRSLNV